jgi:hypothetical protein
VVSRRYFLETLGTLFHGKRASVELIVRVIACLAEGLGLRGTARVFEVNPNTVLQWLVDAAEQLRAFSHHFLHDMNVNQVQLDELFALLNAVKDGKVSEAEAIERLERSPEWVWGAWTPRASCCVRSTSTIVPWQWPSALSTPWRRCWPRPAPHCY